MKTLGIEIQISRSKPILAIGILAGMLLPGYPHVSAATPTLPTVLSDLAIGLAGEFLHDGVQWYFSESPDRPETLDAKASLVTINNKRDYRNYYSNALMSQRTESTSKDSRYEKFKYTAVYLIWSEEDDCFYWGSTIAKHGMNFVDLSPLMSAGVDPDQESSGYYLYWGETEKTDADHFLRSTVSGSTDTLQLSRQGSDKSYSVITDFKLNDVFFDSNGDWQEVARTRFTPRSDVMSAAVSQNQAIEILQQNTSLSGHLVHGWSTLFWKKVTRSVTYTLPTATDFFTPFPDCDEDCCSSDRNPVCYNHGWKSPIMNDQPVTIHYKDWEVGQNFGH